MLVPLATGVLVILVCAILGYAVWATRRTQRLLARRMPLRHLWIPVLFGSSLPIGVSAAELSADPADPDVDLIGRESRAFKRNAVIGTLALVGSFLVVYGTC